MVENGCSNDGMTTTAATVNRTKHVFSIDAAEFIPSWKIRAVDEVDTFASG